MIGFLEKCTDVQTSQDGSLARGAKSERPRKKYGQEFAEITGRALRPRDLGHLEDWTQFVEICQKQERPPVPSRFKVVVMS